MASLKTVKVIMEDEQYNYATSVNGACSSDDIRKYFVGQTFDVGSGDNELMVKCVDVIEVTETE